jgi:hypothetical protein
MELRKAYGEVGEAKGKILILCKSANKNFINSHLLWMKYFLLICEGNIAVFA